MESLPITRLNLRLDPAYHRSLIDRVLEGKAQRFRGGPILRTDSHGTEGAPRRQPGARSRAQGIEAVLNFPVELSKNVALVV